MVINGEVVVQLDDALGLHLELPVGVLGPPLLDVAVAVVLASCGPRHMTSERGGDVRSRPAHHLLPFSAAQLNPEPTLAAVAAHRAKRAAPPANYICRIKATAGYLPKKLGGAQTPNSHTQNDYSAGRLVGRCFTPS